MKNIYNNNLFHSLLLDSPSNLYFQNPSTIIAEELILFHDFIMFFLIMTSVAVIYSMYIMIVNKQLIAHKHLIHGTTLEIIWTSIPALILIVIAIPSFKLLYLIDEIIDPSITVRAIGRQWYWSYQYSDLEEEISFDSYALDQEDLEEGQLRLLSVDNNLVLPAKTHIRVLVTGADVMHAFAVPSLAIKADACPGQLNALSFIMKRTGIFYGVCAELCGPAHYKMPIVIESVSVQDYCNWILSQ